jgi:hypothetical protein
MTIVHTNYHGASAGYEFNTGVNKVQHCPAWWEGCKGSHSKM